MFVGVFLAAVAVTDLLIRFWSPIPGAGYGAWAGYPGSELDLIIEPDHFEAVHRYNRYGFRGGDFPIVPRTTFRVVAIGDSYTEGTGARESETWPNYLNAELSDLDIEVINLGDGGADPARYAEIIRGVGIALKPTDIVVSILPSDLRSGPRLPKNRTPLAALPDPFRQGRQGLIKLLVAMLPGWVYLAERAQGKWPVQKGSMWSPFSMENVTSATRRLARRERISLAEARIKVSERLSRISSRVLDAAQNRRFNPSAIEVELLRPYYIYNVALEDMDVPLPELAEKIERWVDWFATACRESDIRPWIVYFPHAPQIADRPWGVMEDDMYGNRPVVTDDTGVSDLLSTISQRFGVRYIDPTASLKHQYDERLYLRYDTHPTARAYEVVAAKIAAQMRPILRNAMSGN